MRRCVQTAISAGPAQYHVCIYRDLPSTLTDIPFSSCGSGFRHSGGRSRLRCQSSMRLRLASYQDNSQCDSSR